MASTSNRRLPLAQLNKQQFQFFLHAHLGLPMLNNYWTEYEIPSLNGELLSLVQDEQDLIVPFFPRDKTPVLVVRRAMKRLTDEYIPKGVPIELFHALTEGKPSLTSHPVKTISFVADIKDDELNSLQRDNDSNSKAKKVKVSEPRTSVKTEDETVRVTENKVRKRKFNRADEALSQSSTQNNNDNQKKSEDIVEQNLDTKVLDKLKHTQKITLLEEDIGDNIYFKEDDEDDLESPQARKLKGKPTETEEKAKNKETSSYGSKDMRAEPAKKILPPSSKCSTKQLILNLSLFQYSSQFPIILQSLEILDRRVNKKEEDLPRMIKVLEPFNESDFWGVIIKMIVYLDTLPISAEIMRLITCAKLLLIKWLNANIQFAIECEEEYKGVQEDERDMSHFKRLHALLIETLDCMANVCSKNSEITSNFEEIVDSLCSNMKFFTANTNWKKDYAARIDSKIDKLLKFIQQVRKPKTN